MSRRVLDLRAVPWRALFLALWLLIVAGWAADGLKGEALFTEWWGGAAEYRVAFLLAVLIVFVVSGWGLYRIRLDLQVVRTLDQRVARPQKALVLFLSSPKPPPVFGEDGRLTVGELGLPGSDPGKPDQGLREAVEALDKVRWNWQQVLRALIPHASTLTHVHLLGTKGDAGSGKHLGAGEKLIRRYLPEKVIVDISENSVDLDDIEAMIDAIKRSVTKIEAGGVSRASISVDVTGGLKTASIAGSIVTLNTTVRFQYVQTHPPYDVREYHLRVGTGALIP